jgi:uncharacterized protein (DUF1778 family)
VLDCPVGNRTRERIEVGALSRRFEFRASEEDYELIVQAAAEAGLSISDYVRSRTVEDARRELAERRTVRIGPDHAAAFYAALEDAFSGRVRRPIYSRGDNPTVAAFEDKLAAL